MLMLMLSLSLVHSDFLAVDFYRELSRVFHRELTHVQPFSDLHQPGAIAVLQLKFDTGPVGTRWLANSVYGK